MLTQEEAVQFTKLLDKAVNGAMGESQLVEILDNYWENEHNTLGQSLVRAMKISIGHIADIDRGIDGRNEAALEWCQAVTYGAGFIGKNGTPVREPRFIGIPVI